MSEYVIPNKAAYRNYHSNKKHDDKKKLSRQCLSSVHDLKYIHIEDHAHDFHHKTSYGFAGGILHHLIRSRSSSARF